MKIGILETDSFSKKAIQSIQNLGDVEQFQGGDINEFVSDKDILFVRLKYEIKSQTIKSALHLKYICSPTTGLNHIDLIAAASRNIKIISLKGEIEFLETIRATPEHSLGLLLALKRNYNRAFLNSVNSNWNRDAYRGYEIYGSKVGIIGLGRVGKILASYLLAMGAECLYFDIADKRDNGSIQKSSSIESLIAESDTVFLCCSYTPGSEFVIGKTEIDAMKGLYFINTARAELTDEPYLLEKAKQGHFKGLAIDVLQNEQSEENLLSEWLLAESSNNILITPHIGGATYTSMERTEEFIAKKLLEEIAKG